MPLKSSESFVPWQKPFLISSGDFWANGHRMDKAKGVFTLSRRYEGIGTERHFNPLSLTWSSFIWRLRIQFEFVWNISHTQATHWTVVKWQKGNTLRNDSGENIWQFWQFDWNDWISCKQSKWLPQCTPTKVWGSEWVMVYYIARMGGLLPCFNKSWSWASF